MESRSKEFITWWSLILIALVILVAAFNVVVNPYRVFDLQAVTGFNAHKAEAVNQEWAYKAYEVQRIAPRTVILGSSRVAYGMDAQSVSWPREYDAVYNLGLQSAGPYAWFRYLQHLAMVRVPETIVVGVDFEYFLQVSESKHSAFGDFESRLSVNSNGTPNTHARLEHALDLLQFSLSYDTVLDSINTVIENVRGDVADTVLGDEPDDQRIEQRMGVGTFPWVQWINVMNTRRLVGPRNKFAMTDLRELLDFCRSHDTRVILYIHPMPADMLEMLDLAGYWTMFEDWKRELVSEVAADVKRHGRVVLWDFSDYDAYSTQTLRQDGVVLPWFWESWHYTKALGDLIVGRIVGGSELPFGVLLTPDGLEGHLAQVRERRRQYRASHPADVARLKAVRDIAQRVLSSPTMAARRDLP